MVMSKRYGGGVTVRTPSFAVTGRPRRDSASSHCCCVRGMPITLAARATRRLTGFGSGSFTRWSSMGPASPPQISMMSRVMCSMCSTVWLGSTPRSKRCPASVEKLKRRERPWMACGHQNAAST